MSITPKKSMIGRGRDQVQLVTLFYGSYDEDFEDFEEFAVGELADSPCCGQYGLVMGMGLSTQVTNIQAEVSPVSVETYFQVSFVTSKEDVQVMLGTAIALLGAYPDVPDLLRFELRDLTPDEWREVAHYFAE
jgi:hypothetical protein